LNGEIFNIILEAKVITENWRKHYIQIRLYNSLGCRPLARAAMLPVQVVST